MPARLIVEAGSATPAFLELDDGAEVLIGRSRDSQVFVQDRHASRRHARIHQAGSGGWLLTDEGTTNGTRLDGRRVDTAPLADGQVVSIGAVRLRFRLTGDEETTVVEQKAAPADPFDSSGSTWFEADDLTALLRFTTSSMAEESPQGLIGRALDAIMQQTGAAVAGFLSLDPDRPELRLVRPPHADIDAPLSQQLTRAVLRQGHMAWLGSRREASPEAESLSPFTDAVCVPLRGVPGAGREGEMHLGAIHACRADGVFTERQVKFCETLSASLANALEVHRARPALEADNDRLRVHAAAVADEMVGSSQATAKVREQVRRLAEAPCSVLITGESGVGKELVAVGLHRQSPRHRGPLVTVNCAAIAGSLAESELFGHMRGSFTGAARDHSGLFAQADLGTLFLDEVGELSLDMQAKLLRAIETRSFRPVGARSDMRADVRILAATNRDLEKEVREGRFRRDLYFRLTARIHVPPLRERPEDVPDLVQHFLEHLSREYGRAVRVAAPALERLKAYAWPGNVRQLRSVLESAVANCGERGEIQASDLGLIDDLSCTQPEMPATLDLVKLEEWAIRQALRRTGGNVTHAAQALGLHRATLHAKMKRIGLAGEGEE